MEDEFDILDGEISDETVKVERPSFLTVLCILTFIGAGGAFIYGAFNIFTLNALERATDSLGSMLDSQDDFGFGSTYRWMKISVYLNLIGALLCLAGALVMWKLRKSGYFIYIFGQVIPLVGTFFTMSSTFNNAFVGLGIFMTVLYMIFPIGFIVMYGLNYKHLK